MTATSSEDVRGILCSFSAALGEPEKERLDSNLSHLGRVGDEMVAGLGGMLTDSFPSVVAIHELYTFSKTVALLLGKIALLSRPKAFIVNQVLHATGVELRRRDPVRRRLPTRDIPGYVTRGKFTRAQGHALGLDLVFWLSTAVL